MLPDSALKNMYPIVMTPSHDGKYFHNYTLSLLNLVSSSFHVGLNMQISLQRGESLITRARNNAVANFLANPQWTHLFWIDSDIGFSPQAATVYCCPATMWLAACIRSNMKTGRLKAFRPA